MFKKLVNDKKKCRQESLFRGVHLQRNVHCVRIHAWRMSAVEDKKLLILATSGKLKRLRMKFFFYIICISL